jgi:hypothetical protein
MKMATSILSVRVTGSGFSECFGSSRGGGRSLDLSSSFREQPLEGKAETNGHCDNAGVADETEEATPNLNPEEAAASLDPVTERLMTLMREKGQR